MTWFLFALMLGTMLVGVPILLAIALVGYVGVAAVPDLVLPLFAQKMFAQLDSFTLLALPYFILAGGLMSASGMSQQLVDFSRVLVGHLRAGLAHASVVASMVFAGISGSSTADASATRAIAATYDVIQESMRNQPLENWLTVSQLKSVMQPHFNIE